MASSWQADLPARRRQSAGDGSSFTEMCEIHMLPSNRFDLRSLLEDIPTTEVARPHSRSFETAGSRNIPAGCRRSPTPAERLLRSVPRPDLL